MSIADTISSYQRTWSITQDYGTAGRAWAFLRSGVASGAPLVEAVPPIVKAPAITETVSDYELCSSIIFCNVTDRAAPNFGYVNIYGENLTLDGLCGEAKSFFAANARSGFFPAGGPALGGNFFYDPCPSEIGISRTFFESPFQRRLQLLNKLDFYHHVRQAIEEEIGLLKYDFLYDESTAIVQSHQDKLAEVDDVIEKLQLLQQDPYDLTHLTAYATAELSASAFTDLYALRWRRTLRSLTSWRAEPEMESVLLPRRMFSFLRRGQFLRLVLKKRPVDIRGRFRNLVRTLFKLMDDQSGHDEFLAPNQSLLARIYSSTKIWFQHENGRHYRRA